ncbi:MAG: VOC family protein [Miltoncostaeaceae bacterium]
MTAQASSPLGPIHHVGYVVADLDAALDRLHDLAATTVQVREVMEEQGVEAAMCATDGGLIELITPLDPEGAIARFLEKRGEGFHHVAFAVPDAAGALTRLAEAGAELLDATPRRGLGDHLVAFVHPRSVLGVLTEVVQDDHAPA